ncbi:hypothetical protein MLD38_022063 [Melastoma candidum]|uniref:Uncharacterized protein n=1 Tax=Melastoma candidum TaxID=119954 RepID=A0ACB9QI17_9MYRT|nr:hypothetical protein MLD38_022063 [Melastoma candidum]
MDGCGGNRGGSSRRRRKRGKEVESLRKGPWKAEEDEILLSHVRRHGPCNWSSIRSNGLLQRTGKSCRLRWVNKLRPDLKNGCKFSAEEERVVIELQAEFGNKWARIATYLPGRTDNDVKNFWSSRQKRLARILRASPSLSASSSRPQKNKRKILASHDAPRMAEIKPHVVEGLSAKPEQCHSSNQGYDPTNLMPQMSPLDVIYTAPLLSIPSTFYNSEILHPNFSIDGNLHKETQPHSSCHDFSNLQSRIPFGQDSQSFPQILDDPEYFNLIGPEAVNSGQFSVDTAFLQSPGAGQSNTTNIDDTSMPCPFFEDLPSCMPDQFEQLPSPSRW